VDCTKTIDLYGIPYICNNNTQMSNSKDEAYKKKVKAFEKLLEAKEALKKKVRSGESLKDVGQEAGITIVSPV
jgi:hypothetical protein